MESYHPFFNIFFLYLEKYWTGMFQHFRKAGSYNNTVQETQEWPEHWFKKYQMCKDLIKLTLTDYCFTDFTSCH